MVRNIVGNLIEVGKGNRPEIWIKNLLNKCDRSYSTITAPPEGLCLIEVDYPLKFNLPLLKLEYPIFL